MVRSNPHIDPWSGYCQANGIYYSRRPQVALPNDQSLDITSFIVSSASKATTDSVVALVDAETSSTLTYKELHQHVSAMTSTLYGLGIKKGDVVLIMAPNSLGFVVLTMAIMNVGAIFTAANPLHTQSEIAQQIADSKPVLAYTTHDLSHKLSTHKIPIMVLNEVKKDLHMESFASNPCSVNTSMPKEAQAMQGDAATVHYSSGTTGKSKGVVSTHANLITISSMLQKVMKKEHTYLCYVPLYHMYGFSVFILGALAVGAKVVILPSYSLNNLLHAIENYQVTSLPAVPTTAFALYKNPDVVKRYNIRTLRQVLASGAPMSRAQMEEFCLHFPHVELLQAYGLTEVSGPVIWSEGMDSDNFGSAGTLLPNVEARIVDMQTGMPVKPGVKGEMYLRGPMVMKGYLNNEAATRLAIDGEGWFHTGDICQINNHGRIFVLDRSKEMIKYKGFQVSPAELEEILLNCVDVEDCAVIRYPDEDVGEVPMAIIVKKHGREMTANQVIEYVAGQVAPYKKVRKVAFVTSIPRSASGKVLRRLVVSEVLKAHGSQHSKVSILSKM